MPTARHQPRATARQPGTAPRCLPRPVVLRHARAVLAMTAAPLPRQTWPASTTTARREGRLSRRPGRSAAAGDLPAAARHGPGEPGIRGRGRHVGGRQGISQVIDLGAGLPATPLVHQAARTVIPTARVAYVDIDAVVLSHARALLATWDGVTVVAADLRDPQAVFASRGAAGGHRPGAAGVRHPRGGLAFHGRRRRPRGDLGIRPADGAGSCLVISVARFDDEALAKQLAEEYTAAEWHNPMAGTSRRSSPGWRWQGPVSARRTRGGHGSLSRCSGAAMVTCWPAWHGAVRCAMRDPDVTRLRPPSFGTSGATWP